MKTIIGNLERATWRNSKSGIIVPGRFVEGNEIALPCSAAGHFSLQALKDGQVKSSLEFDNLITNVGLNGIGGPSVYALTCAVGTGVSPPAFTDASLAQLVSSTNSVTNSAGGYTPNASSAFTMTSTFTWSIGAAVGNFTEIGCGSSATNLHSRALIVDNLGNPTAFPVAADEQLRVTYTRGYYPIASPILTTQTLSGTTYDVEIRAIAGGSTSSSDAYFPFRLNEGSSSYFQVGVGSAFPSAWGGSMPGTSYGSTSRGNTTYVNNSFENNFQGTWAAGTATATLRNTQFQLGGFTFGAVYGSPLVKTATMNMILPFTVGWGRA